MTEPEKPYAGLFVLDASQGIAGPYCATLLAACGADVVKVEPPAGDWSRGLSTRAGSHSVMSTTFNRGKRGIVLDLHTPSGRAAFATLAARADVMLEAFRPGVASRLGIVPEAGKDDVVFVSISGFGQRGPNTERPGTDGIMQAYTGMVALNRGTDGVPHRTGAIMTVDVTTGLSAFAAVQVALAARALDQARGVPPRRRVLDVSLMQSAAALIALNLAEHGLLGRTPDVFSLPAGTYAAACGSYVMIALVREADFPALCTVLELPDLSAEPRFADFSARYANREALLPIIREAFLRRSAAAWLERFAAARLLCDRVNDPLEFLADPHVAASGAMVPLAQPGLGTLPYPALPGIGAWSVPAPGLGEHTEDVLTKD